VVVSQGAAAVVAHLREISRLTASDDAPAACGFDSSFDADGEELDVAAHAAGFDHTGGGRASRSGASAEASSERRPYTGVGTASRPSTSRISTGRCVPVPLRTPASTPAACCVERRPKGVPLSEPATRAQLGGFCLVEVFNNAFHRPSPLTLSLFPCHTGWW
jgi:hypothetical protein